jgi:hypothetical protein
VGCQIRDGDATPSPTLPDLQNLKDLEDGAIGSAHSKGFTHPREKTSRRKRNAAMDGRESGRNSTQRESSRKACSCQEFYALVND